MPRRTVRLVRAIDTTSVGTRTLWAILDDPTSCPFGHAVTLAVVIG
jgi:hypothetical protein